jgi:hypothetical protein
MLVDSSILPLHAYEIELLLNDRYLVSSSIYGPFNRLIFLYFFLYVTYLVTNAYQKEFIWSIFIQSRLENNTNQFSLYIAILPNT